MTVRKLKIEFMQMRAISGVQIFLPFGQQISVYPRQIPIWYGLRMFRLTMLGFEPIPANLLKAR